MLQLGSKSTMISPWYHSFPFIHNFITSRPLKGNDSREQCPVHRPYFPFYHSTFNPLAYACLTILSSTNATTQQHSAGPLPEVICKYTFSFITSLLIHSNDARHKFTLHFHQRFLRMHHSVNILICQWHFFHTPTNQSHSRLRQ